MESSLFLITNKREIFAKIENVQRTETLRSVRNRVNIADKENFDFLLFGTALKRKQEAKTLLEDCDLIKTSNFDADLELTIKVIKEPVGPVEVREIGQKPSSSSQSVYKPGNTPSTNQRELSVSAMVSDDQNDLQAASFPTQEFPIRRAHKLPIFSEEEISGDVTGVLTKEKMRFHNSMVKRIEKDTSLQRWATEELLGVIESSWVMKRTELLKVKVREVVIAKPTGRTDTGEERNIMTNLAEVERAHFDVQREYGIFCSGLDNARDKREMLEKKFDLFFTTLKQRQAKFEKAIEAYYSSSMKKTTSSTPPVAMNETPEPEELSTDELEFLVEGIHAEYGNS